MSIYDYAMQLEKEGEEFYVESAQSAASPGLSKILMMLATAERAHYATFERMKRNEPVTVAETAILTDTKNVFQKMREEGGWRGIRISEINLYRKAQGIERTTEVFYLEQAQKLAGKPQKVIFQRIADEERRHLLILQNIIDFVSQPESWLENAEWYHLDEY